MPLPAKPAGRVRDRAGVAFLCLWTMGMNSSVAVALSPALPRLAAELGRGEGADNAAFIAQLIQTLPAVAMIVAAALVGYVSERIGRRGVMLGSTVLFTLAGAVGLMAPDLMVLAGARFVQGLASGAMVTTAYAVVAEYFDEERRDRMLGYCAAYGAFSTIIVLGLAGPLVDALGWRSVFAIYLGASLSLPFILTRMHGERPRRSESQPLSWKPILALWPLWCLQIVFTIGMYMSVIQVPFVAAGKGIFSGATISLLIATTSIMATLASVVNARLRRRVGFWGVFAVVALAYGLGLLICVNAQGLPTFLLGAAVLGIGAGSVEPTLIARALQDTPQALHDRAAGAAMGTNFAGQFLNPVVVRPFLAFGGINGALTGFGYGYVAAGLAIALMVIVMRPVAARG
ncbi:MAG: MFS transporter [Novosphingobium sp.]